MSDDDTRTLVVMAPPESNAIEATLLDAIASAAGIAGGGRAATRLGRQAYEWALPARAADAVGGAAIDAVGATVAGRPVDVAIVRGSPALRRKRLLVADMESTIIEQEMLDEIAGEIGLRDKVADITERAMRGELDFEAAITERVRLLAGIDAGVLDRLADARVTYMPGARTLVATMRGGGAYCALVSGGFTHFTQRVARELGFDEHQANMLGIEGGRLSGRVIPPILGKDAKLAALRRTADRLGLDASDAVSVGDGANDLAMLEAAGIGVAFHAKPKVRDAAATFGGGVVVTHCDLTALLYVQGYRDAEFRS